MRLQEAEGAGGRLEGPEGGAAPGVPRPSRSGRRGPEWMGLSSD